MALERPTGTALRTLWSLLLLGAGLWPSWWLPLVWWPAGLALPLCAVLTHVLLMRWALAWLTLRPAPLDSSWYTVRPWETPLYRRLGALRYRNLLRRVGWERFRRGALAFDGTRASLAAYDRATREAEYSHLLLAAAGFGALVISLGLRAWAATSWLLITTLFFQVYPALLQRLLRARVQRLRFQSAHTSSAQT
jgi:Glycosyl-4,4'-diaponeurosporenoate acyltransferase